MVDVGWATGVGSPKMSEMSWDNNAESSSTIGETGNDEAGTKAIYG
jgi:hypothetical protein